MTLEDEDKGRSESSGGTQKFVLEAIKPLAFIMLECTGEIQKK